MLKRNKRRSLRLDHYMGKKIAIFFSTPGLHFVGTLIEDASENFGTVTLDVGAGDTLEVRSDDIVAIGYEKPKEKAPLHVVSDSQNSQGTEGSPGTSSND